MNIQPVSVRTETLFLLDRNVVAIIKTAVLSKEQPDDKKKAALEALRAIDLPQYSISPILSIIEGEKGREDDAHQKALCLKTEADAIGEFFKLANTDAAHLGGLKSLASEIFAGVKESQWDNRADFLGMAAPLVVQKVATEDRRHVEDKLVELAAATGLAANDAIVMLFLACLHGSNDARKVIKPAKPNPYNALSDLHVIPRVGLIRAVARQLPTPVNVLFRTLDEGLFGVLSKVDIVLSHLTDDGELKMQIRYKPELFPELALKDAIIMLQRLADITAAAVEGSR
ncbi:hypothetical protein BVER_02724 [Candidatus Burkholderia verschuerenii]|uniref:Uncharacterized protein n=1 Tax=Candidatus Burkholderia verschuerenii TaxID=242163 RepID=A0A0L0M4Y7_9BURK|nr:hypothetical protein [Candidatus Burkholderia verschuerenii]KND57341.1 hypothetical protein BVER_02724 [Candidatus Burkholderia verschuerenii]